jgi:hypothetical protein
MYEIDKAIEYLALSVTVIINEELLARHVKFDMKIDHGHA